MDKVILNTKFVKVLFDDEYKIYTSIYHPETENMTDKEWQDQMLELKNLIEIHKPDFIIDDNRNRLYSYSPEMQIWTLNLFIESWNKIGVQKYAQVTPLEIVGKLTSKQIEEFAVNDFNMQFRHKFFNDCESALYWVKSAE